MVELCLSIELWYFAPAEGLACKGVPVASIGEMGSNWNSRVTQGSISLKFDKVLALSPKAKHASGLQ